MTSWGLVVSREMAERSDSNDLELFSWRRNGLFCPRPFRARRLKLSHLSHQLCLVWYVYTSVTLFYSRCKESIFFWTGIQTHLDGPNNTLQSCLYLTMDQKNSNGSSNRKQFNIRINIFSLFEKKNHFQAVFIFCRKIVKLEQKKGAGEFFNWTQNWCPACWLIQHFVDWR